MNMHTPTTNLAPQSTLHTLPALSRSPLASFSTHLPVPPAPPLSPPPPSLSLSPCLSLSPLPALPKPQPLGIRIPALPSGQKPNFIVVLTDDQGFDDLGLHQPQQPGGKPQWVSTPNLDKFMQQSMEFRNFYVSPMCSQSRAELLTGRAYQRTGTMLINGGALGGGLRERAWRVCRG